MKKSKPFLKWAGGKTQLIEEISNLFPEEYKNEEFTYIEPFVGSGAVLFWVLNNFPNLEKAIINDINIDLINTYQIIKNKPTELIYILEELQTEYYELSNDPDKKKLYYYEKRSLFNSRLSDNLKQAGLFIFLNRTCFNGLFRVNSKNQFNVPIGSYVKPLICDSENILKVSKSLKKVTIISADFEETLNFANKKTLFYFDPPYKPLDKTSSFNSYSKDDFNDKEQIRLRDFCKNLDIIGHKWILSNSDVKSNNPENNFFDDIYSDFTINRVWARRNINSNSSKRGKLKELIINNYEATTEMVII
jgi:DNA adenine methylase